MNPNEYRDARERLGLTNKKLGELIGVSERQSSRYANGKSKIHKAVAMRLKELIERKCHEAARP